MKNTMQETVEKIIVRKLQEVDNYRKFTLQEMVEKIIDRKMKAINFVGNCIKNNWQEIALKIIG